MRSPLYKCHCQGEGGGWDGTVQSQDHDTYHSRVHLILNVRDVRVSHLVLNSFEQFSGHTALIINSYWNTAFLPTLFWHVWPPRPWSGCVHPNFDKMDIFKPFLWTLTQNKTTVTLHVTINKQESRSCTYSVTL